MRGPTRSAHSVSTRRARTSSAMPWNFRRAPIAAFALRGSSAREGRRVDPFAPAMESLRLAQTSDELAQAAVAVAIAAHEAKTRATGGRVIRDATGDRDRSRATGRGDLDREL